MMLGPHPFPCLLAETPPAAETRPQVKAVLSYMMYQAAPKELKGLLQLQ